MSEEIISIIRNLEEAIKEDQDQDSINDYEEKLSENIEITSKIAAFYLLPIEHIFSIISKVDFESNTKSKLIIQNIIQNTNIQYQKESSILLNAFHCKNCNFSLKDCIQIIECFSNSELCMKINDLYNENSQKDQTENRLEEIENEISTIKQQLANIQAFPVSQKPPDYENSIWNAIQKGKITSVQYLFENKGIDREMKNEQNLTPLLYACSEGKLPIVKYLIEKQNVRTDATDQNKHDVLQLACRLGHLDIVEYLCEERSYGDFLKQNKYECSQCPLCIAAEAGQLNIVQYFVEKVGLDINQIDGYGMRPLLSACKSDITIVKYLCEKGANIDCFSNTGDSVLHIACLSGKLNIIKYFIEEIKYQNINAQNTSGKTPLHLAARLFDLNIAEYLLANGADKTIKDKNGKMAYKYASSKEMKKLLK